MQKRVIGAAVAGTFVGSRLGAALTLGAVGLGVSGVFVDWTYVGSAALYALLYVALLLIVAVGLFSRRDFV